MQSMKKILLLKTLSVPALLVLLTGCGSQEPKHYHAGNVDFLGLHQTVAYIGYPGEIKPINEVGIVTLDFKLHLKEIDGIPVENYRALKSGRALYPKSFARATDMPYPERSQIHFTSGEHRLKFGFIEYGKTRYKSIGDVVRTITIDPGTVTHVSLALSRGDLKWTVALSDGKKGLDLIKKDFDKLLKLKEVNNQ